ncbi:MAG: substrate-binding domain-containing protein [Chitinivibrionales bacterium]|nr:substrate-binding domain-containing protein [Chitinivibrionales bacterium]
MKHHQNATSFVTIVFILCSMIATVAGEKKKSGTVKIGLSLPTQREERWVRDKNSMEEYAKSKGVKLLVQISDTDSRLQANQVDNLLTQGVSVLILVPHDSKAAATLVENAHKEGVKVISYDRLILDSDVDLYISFDNVDVGRIQGKYLSQKVPKGNYMILSGAPTDNNAKLFKQGAMEFLQPLIDSKQITVILEQAVDNWEPKNALRLTEQALTKANNKIDAILAPNDGTAGGAIEALAAQGLSGKVFVTGQDAQIDAAKRIAKGTQSMTVFKDTRELAKASIDAAILMVENKQPDTKGKQVNNGKINVPSILLTPIEVTRDNIDAVLIDGKVMTKEQVYN